MENDLAGRNIDGETDSIYDLEGGEVSTDKKEVGINNAHDAKVHCKDPKVVKVLFSENVTVIIYSNGTIEQDQSKVRNIASTGTTVLHESLDNFGKRDVGKQGQSVGNSFYAGGGISNSNIVINKKKK